MPISGGKYVAPTWNNGASPAIDASELQDICDTVAAHETGLYLETGSYVGTGTYGSGNPNVITCTRKPQILWVGAKRIFGSAGKLSAGINTDGFLVMRPTGYMDSYVTLNQATDATETIKWNYNSEATKVGWYSTKADAQFNQSGMTYYWFALCADV